MGSMQPASSISEGRYLAVKVLCLLVLLLFLTSPSGCLLQLPSLPLLPVAASV